MYRTATVVLCVGMFASTAHAQGKSNWSEVSQAEVPAGWTKLTKYPEECRDKMNQVDGALAGKDVLVERWLLEKKAPRTSIWLIRTEGGDKMVVLFGWDDGGSLCQMENYDKTKPPT